MTTSDFLQRLHAATALLEDIVADRALLAGVPADDQRRLLQAAGHVYSPDAIARRRLVRATIRAKKATKVSREDQRARRHRYPHAAPPAGLHQPECLPAGRVRAARSGRRPRVPGADRAAALLRLQGEVHRDPPLLRPALPAVRRVQLRQAHRDGRPQRAGWRCSPADGSRSAIRRASSCSGPARGSSSPPASPATRRRATPGSRTSPTGATGSRSSGSISGTRRASRPSATSCWRPATGSTSSSTTPARPSAARPSSTST